MSIRNALCRFKEAQCCWLLRYIYIGRIGFSGSDYDRSSRDKRRLRGSGMNCHMGKAPTMPSFDLHISSRQKWRVKTLFQTLLVALGHMASEGIKNGCLY